MEELKKIKTEIGKPVMRIVGILQLLNLMLFIASFFVWIWHSWDLAWKLGLSSFIGILILYFISEVVKSVVSDIVDEEIKKQSPQKPLSKFQKKMNEMMAEAEAKKQK